MKKINTVLLILLLLGLQGAELLAENSTEQPAKPTLTVINDHPTNCCGGLGTVIICSGTIYTVLSPGKSIKIILHPHAIKILRPLTNMMATKIYYVFDVTYVSNNSLANQEKSFQVNLSSLPSFDEDSYSIHLDDNDTLKIKKAGLTSLFVPSVENNLKLN